RRILSHEYGFDLRFQDGLNDPRTSLDHPEIAIAPAGNACVGENAKYHTAGCRAEIVNGITSEFRLRQTQEIGLYSSDLHLLTYFSSAFQREAERRNGGRQRQ